MVDAREYHQETNHSPRSVRERKFSPDESNRPRPYKVYADLPRFRPDASREPPETPALRAIAHPRPEPTTGEENPDDPPIHALCHYATGVTKELEVRGEPMRFRAASCTGKLYHVDLYAVAGDCGAFDPGVYHFDPHEDAFDLLRAGDYRGVLAEAAGGETGVTEAPVTFVATSQWWRNAWKYRARAYRHAFWDSGTILANLLAVAHGFGHRAAVVTGFADERVADLVGVDPPTEAPLELVPVGQGDPVPEAPEVEPIDPEEEPVSPEPGEYPLIGDAWQQSALGDGAAARSWRERFADATTGTHGAGDRETVELDPVDDETASARPISETIERRGSLREYAHEPVSDRKLATILDRSLRGVPADCYGVGGVDSLLDCYCIALSVDGVPRGTYQYHPDSEVLERLGDVDRQRACHLALDQAVVGDAAVNVYLMADVDAVVDSFGDRGYRVAQLEAGITLGRLYLATYAHLGLGGRGFTFYDALVAEHLEPRAPNQMPMTMFAFGKPEE